MTLASPLGLLLLGLAVPVLALHVLRPHRIARPVSSTLLWQELASPVSAARPWQRLRVTPLLVLQLLAVIALAVAAAQPARLTPTPLALHTVFVVDASGSMAALDGEPDRLAGALQRAREMHGELPAGGQASVVVASDRPRVALTASRDTQAFEDALGTVRTSAGEADFAEAFALAASLEAPGVPIGFVLLSDGGLDDAGRRLLPPGTRHEVIGSDSTNRALHRLSIEPRGSGLHARVAVVNTGGPAATQTVRFDVDGRTAEKREVTVGPGESFDGDVDLPAGTRVEAFLEGEDLLGADDRAVAVSGTRRAVKVMVAGPPNVVLDAVLGVVPDVTVERVAQSQPATGFDLAIYDRVPVPADPGAPFLAIAPPGGAPDVVVEDRVVAPAVALVRSDDALLAGLDLSGVLVDEAQKVRSPKAETLIGAEGAPLLVRGVLGNRPYLYLAFALEDSSLLGSEALPVIFDRAVTEVASAAPPPTDLVVGGSLPVTPGVAATVVDPVGQEIPVSPGAVAPVATRPGFWTIRVEGRPEQVVAVNAAPDESRLAPVTDLPVPEPVARPGAEVPAGQVPLLPWIALAIVVLVVAEVLLSRRRVGVARRQWHAALVLRVGIAVLLLAALADVAVVRSADRVATVFLIDGSDSMAAGSRAEAVGWVRDALAHQPDDAVSGVVLFARDARVELTVRERQELGQPAVRIDGSRTNLASALRLAAALLPEDARRRVVVVSDGRVTEGDTTSEAHRLAEQGVRVDVHAVTARQGADAAVTVIDAPGRARPGERVDLSARIESSFAGTAVVTLDRDGQPVDERTVELKTGTNTVTFSVVVPPDRLPSGNLDAGIDRYRIRVAAGPDTVSENNVAYAPVQIERPARVLVAEGASGRGDELVAALRAASLPVDAIDARRLPGVDELAGYASVVLVDVDERDLSTEQVGALASSTRDLGHGLVTVGGDRSYGMGGYRHTPLEELLPVISELKDPKRKQKVAQVLAIDTSGSMGACHSATGGNGMGGGNLVSGGVDKTDISRAGAARAIEALDKNDEVGLLSVSGQDQWVLDLQTVPAEDVVREGLDKLSPAGTTDLSTSLQTSAEALRKSKASLKHIILFTDGFTSGGEIAELERQAAALSGSGITVSVLATGEGQSGRELEKVAIAGRGRFYPGHDLHDIPQIMQDEMVMASRSFINEGEFVPEVTASDDVVADLRRSPPLLGYVGTTAKPTATTQLRIGPERDPLLATWSVGLGRAASWTSDARARWAQQWLPWAGYVDFWSRLVKSTFAHTDLGGSVSAQIRGDTLTVRAESETPFPDGAIATARVTGPDLQGHDVPLSRLDATTFAGELPVSQSGSYAVGARVTGRDGSPTVLAASTLVSQAYSAEYRPRAVDPSVLASVAALTEGRVEPAPDAVFRADGLVPGRTRIPLAAWFLLAAALAWPLALALSRLALRRPVAWALPGRRLLPTRLLPSRRAPSSRPTVRPPTNRPPSAAMPTLAPRDPDPPPPPAPPEDAPTGPGTPATTLDQLLARKRDRSAPD